MQVCAKHWVYNNKPTVFIMCFFFFFVHLLSFVFVDTVQQNYKKLRTKTNERKKILQKPLGHFFHTETLNISWKITSIYSHWWVYDCCVEAGGGGRAAMRVALSSCCLRENVRCVCLWVSARVLSASGDMWRVRSAGASTVSSLENLNAAKIKVLKCQIWTCTKKKCFQNHKQQQRKKKCSRHWTDCDFKQKNPHF